MSLAFRRISAVGTARVAEPGAELWTVNVNTGAATSILTIYNALAATGAPVAIIDCSSKSSHAYGVRLDGGIFVEMSGANSDVTIGHS